MKALNGIFNKSKGLFYWLGAIIILYPICFGLFYFSEETQIPMISTSSGIVAIISAIIGVLLTAFAISIQLKQQSDAETKKDKDVKIHEQKIQIYSNFTEKMWSMLDNDNTGNGLKDLQKICFQKLVFYLNNDQISKISEAIGSLEYIDDDKTLKAFGEITHILQSNLDNTNNVNVSNLINLFNSFGKNNIFERSKEETINSTDEEVNNITFWHFNMLGDEQIKAFKNGNWCLSLIEYGEDWRTNSLKQVRPNDVVFLFRRGGYGYIGAFKATGNKILEDKKHEKGEYDEKCIEKYDMYKSLEDEATFASNILVEPLAYNFKGVGYYSVRRYTIQRMNDMEAVKFLLNRFNGKELTAEQTSGIGKLDEKTEVKISDENKNYLSEITKKYL